MVNNYVRWLSFPITKMCNQKTSQIQTTSKIMSNWNIYNTKWPAMHRSHQTNVSSMTQISPVLDERPLHPSLLLCKDCIKCGGVSGANMVTSLLVESLTVLSGPWHDTSVALVILVKQWSVMDASVPSYSFSVWCACRVWLES